MTIRSIPPKARAVMGRVYPSAFPGARCHAAAVPAWLNYGVLRCTRPAQHDGPHVAHDARGFAFARWGGNSHPAGERAACPSSSPSGPAVPPPLAGDLSLDRSGGVDGDTQSVKTSTEPRTRGTDGHTSGQARVTNAPPCVGRRAHDAGSTPARCDPLSLPHGAAARRSAGRGLASRGETVDAAASADGGSIPPCPVTLWIDPDGTLRTIEPGREGYYDRHESRIDLAAVALVVGVVLGLFALAFELGKAVAL